MNKTNVNSGVRWVILILAAISLTGVARSEESTAASADDPTNVPEDAGLNDLLNSSGPPVVEELVVLGSKTTIQLRTELTQLDDEIFSLYNTLNSNDELDMICKKETRVGSQIKHRVCKSVHHREIESEAGSAILEGDDESAYVATLRLGSNHYAQVRSKMAQLMSENHELSVAIQKRAVLRQAIEDSKSKD